MALEADLFGIVGSTHDVKEGLSAFVERRDPNFEGR
jgi:enoyl-CoA hydratase/carnithine racemase